MSWKAASLESSSAVGVSSWQEINFIASSIGLAEEKSSVGAEGLLLRIAITSSKIVSADGSNGEAEGSVLLFVIFMESFMISSTDGKAIVLFSGARMFWHGFETFGKEDLLELDSVMDFPVSRLNRSMSAVPLVPSKLAIVVFMLVIQGLSKIVLCWKGCQENLTKAKKICRKTT